jgi:hypothetical protein
MTTPLKQIQIQKHRQQVLLGVEIFLLSLGLSSLPLEIKSPTEGMNL